MTEPTRMVNNTEQDNREEPREAGTKDKASSQGAWATKFLLDVMWSWMGVGAGFLTAFFVSPYIIRRLGDQRYGVWALAFAFIDYFILFDFGFKSAIVNLASRARVDNDTERLNAIVNTAFFYFLCLGSALALVTIAFADQVHRLFRISEGLQADFAALVRVIAVGWGTAIALGVFNAMTEAFQLFRFQSTVTSIATVFRAAGLAVVVSLGFGLKEMGWVVLVSQVGMFGTLMAGFWRAFPQLRIDVGLVRWQIWKDLAAYGVHAFVAYLGNMSLTQGPAMMVGHFLPEAFVGYYTLPSRLLQQTVDAITRIGYVIVPNTAELQQRGERATILAMGGFVNRYCVALFMPLAVFLLLFGRDLIQIWVGTGFAEQASPLLTPFVLMTWLAVAGQFNTSQILFGLAKHRDYAYLLLGEAVLCLGSMTYAIPRWGIVGGAWVACGFAILNRGVCAPYLLSRVLDFPLWKYMWGIYFRPTASGAVLMGAAMALQASGFHPSGWIAILSTLACMAIPYYLLAVLVVADPSHREKILAQARRRLSR